MDDGNGGRSRRCESPAGLTLGGILSIKQTPPYRIHERTLLDLIRDDQSCRKETKKMWKMLREKFRLKLAGSVCTTTVPTHVHVTGDSNRVSPSVNHESSVTTVVDAESVNVRTEVVEERERTSPEEDAVAVGGGGGEGEGGESTAARMSLMSLLEVEGSVYFDDDDDDDDDEVVEEEDEAVVDGGGDGGDGGGGGGYRYNNCCVCMVRHKGAAFIPCGHTFCRLCSRELFVKRASCPLCNNFILEILDIF